MRWLEVRRHSLTKKGAARGAGSHLSVAGVEVARRVGTSIERVRYVITSDAPRAQETAIAMGFAIDARFPAPTGYVAGVDHHDQWW